MSGRTLVAVVLIGAVVLSSLVTNVAKQRQQGSGARRAMVFWSSTPFAKPPPLSRVVVAHRVTWWATELGPHWAVPCSWQGQPLPCEYVSTPHAAGNTTAQALLGQARALVSEDCWDPAGVPQEYRSMMQVMFSMESDTNRPCRKGQVADAEMTHRKCSQVWSPYWSFFSATLDPHQAYSTAALRRAPLPIAQKLHAIAYINGNCAAASGRQNVMQQLQALLKQSNSSLAVHSYGRCDPNMDVATLTAFQAASTGSVAKAKKKIETFSKYKFCVSMENSINRDYVSEKLYDGLVAGCVPIVLAASNVADYIPVDNAIINYSQMGSPHALKDELERLAGDDGAYAAKLAWKTQDAMQWNKGFQQLLDYSELHPLCHLCRFVSEANQTGRRNGYTLCSANSSWQPS